MKALISAVGGFCLTLMVFGGGALTAIFFVNAEPVTDRSLDMDTTDLWTNKAVKVSTPSPDLQRLPARPVQQTPDNVRQAQDIPSEAPPLNTDLLTTAAISPDQAGPELTDAHVEWCSERYRSYDPVDNSYNAYSGARRECVSPYSPAGDQVGGYVEAAVYQGEDSVGAFADFEHVQSCFDRYRSYRPEDNTYQPYGGGPRQQCQ